MLRYAASVALTAVAFVVEKYFGEHNTGLVPFFFAAVTVSAWFGGLGPGLLATALSGTATAIFFLEPGEQILGADDFLRTGVFFVVATLTSYLNHHARRAREQAEAAVHEATAANQAKDRFLAMLSHELRNPLAPVLAISEIQENDPALPEAVREDAALIRRNVTMEVRLIDDLLDISRMSRGKLAFHFADLDLHDLVRSTANSVLPDAQAKSLHLQIRLEAPQASLNGDVDPATPIPVLVGDWSEEAERKILAALDPVGSMASGDPGCVSDAHRPGVGLKPVGPRPAPQHVGKRQCPDGRG